MRIVSQPTKDAEVMAMDAAPVDVSIFIFEHQDRRIYLMLDRNWMQGGHPAVYTSPEEMAADKYGQ